MDKRSKLPEEHSKLVLAIILITVGLIWLLRHLGIHLHLDDLFRPFWAFFSHIGEIVFSWPMILVIAGLVLAAGKRQGGWILVVLGGVFLIPKIFHFQDFSLSLVFPLLIIIAGVALIMRRI